MCDMSLSNRGKTILSLQIIFFMKNYDAKRLNNDYSFLDNGNDYSYLLHVNRTVRVNED
jgi:hypothetical protein